MKGLCPEALKLTPKDFLGQDADSGGKGNYQGCSSFNPLIFSQQTEDAFKQAAQNQIRQASPRVTRLMLRTAG